ncbi:two-component system sensor histidine kinase NtrB [Stutzerimonas tarimensis]|uniref:histidine kinase n=1 Tax=Stutzerimonas tarimensis TaxID=1507735 RepID=A0ABV7T1E4_9GAMM
MAQAASDAFLTSRSGGRILGLYHFYRLTVGLALVLLVASELPNELLELSNPTRFHQGAAVYLILNVLASLAMRQLRPAQLTALVLTDVLLLLGLFYFAGGTPSGIGNLVVVSVAIANILVQRRIGLLVAATASLGLVYLTFYLSLDHSAASSQFVQAGALGALCFAAALLVQGLTQRLRVSESLARQRAEDVANLEALNALILQRMRTGILVLDPHNRVLLANHGAMSLLDQQDLESKQIDTQCPGLHQRLQQWLQNPTRRPDPLEATPDGPTLQPSFTPLQHGDQTNLLIFLEDLSQVAQQAQQLKLASLGRLTAGIAHEIRNPLGAISHAAQLLEESEVLEGPDRRLAQIIQDHSRRMNLIIENVLQLSRRRQAEPQLLDLKYWLHRFASEFRARLSPNQQLHVEVSGNALKTRMDPNQFIQVLSNLVQNGLRYSAQQHSTAQVWLKLYCEERTELPTLEIQDDGPGVPPEDAQHIFEPFFTTDTNGTGLGLYLSRELCESNQARIDYLPREGGGSSFRIIFAHPRKLG